MINSSKTFKNWSCLKFFLKSLEDFWLTIIFLFINVLCFYKSFLNLNKFNEKSWHRFPKPYMELYAYVFFLIVNVFIFPFYIWTSFFKIGSYANDGLKYGYDLFKTNIFEQNNAKILAKSQKLKEIQLNFELNLNNTKCFQLKKSNEESVAQPNGFKLILKEVLSLNKAFRLHKLIRYIPVSNVLHIMIAFNFILPNILLTAKEIEYGLRPTSLIHHSQLDFLFSDISNRFSDKKLLHMDPIFFFNLNLQLRTNESLSLTNEDIKKYFSKSSNTLNHEQIHDRHQHLTPRIKLEFFNYIMALFLLMLRYASTFWYLNKIYSIVFSLHLFLYACMSVLILTTFDLLYKYETLFARGIHLSLKNDTQNSQFLVRLPFVTNLSSLILTFLFSVTLLFLSCLPIYAFGIKEYKASFKKLQNHFNAYIHNKNMCKIIINQTYMPATSVNNRTEFNNNNINENEEELYSEYVNPEQFNGRKEESNTSSNYSNYYCSDFNYPFHPLFSQLNVQKETVSIYSKSSSNSGDNHRVILSKKKQLSNQERKNDLYIKILLILKMYKLNFQALFILSALFVVFSYLFLDCLFLYQLTSDRLALLTIIFQALFFLWYFMIWLVLSIKNDLNLKFSHAFKLNYWYFLNKILSFNAPRETQKFFSMSKIDHNNGSVQSSTSSSLFLTSNIKMPNSHSFQMQNPQQMLSPSLPPPPPPTSSMSDSALKNNAHEKNRQKFSANNSLVLNLIDGVSNDECAEENADNSTTDLNLKEELSMSFTNSSNIVELNEKSDNALNESFIKQRNDSLYENFNLGIYNFLVKFNQRRLIIDFIGS